MNKRDSSFWAEIKSLDERLAREPDSFCFARLSEIYLKVGLVADALHTARQGVAKHPGYLAGQRALAMACNANGLNEECRTLLEQVTAAMPEDTAAQKQLASLYIESGDKASAIRSYTTLLDFRPDDAQSRAELEELQQADAFEPPPVMPPAEAAEYDEKIAAEQEADVEEDAEAVAEKEIDQGVEKDVEEEIYELSEDDVVHEEEEVTVEDVELPAAPVAEVPPADHHDPLSTLTLAELYEQQGFIAKALDIYRTILADDPSNEQLQAKIAKLESQDAAAQETAEQPAAPDLDEELEPSVPSDLVDVPVPVESLLSAPPAPEETPTAEPEPFASAAFEDLPAPVEALEFSTLEHKQADNVVGTLDSWLENIRRIKACR